MGNLLVLLHLNGLGRKLRRRTQDHEQRYRAESPRTDGPGGGRIEIGVGQFWPAGMANNGTGRTDAVFALVKHEAEVPGWGRYPTPWPTWFTEESSFGFWRNLTTGYPAARAAGGPAWGLEPTAVSRNRKGWRSRCDWCDRT